MKRFIALVFCALAFAELSACSTQRFEINPNPVTMSMPSYEGTNHFVFWGIGQEQTLYPGNACGPEGVNRVEVQKSFINGLFATLTLGIYAPRSYAVYCNNSR